MFRLSSSKLVTLAKTKSSISCAALLSRRTSLSTAAATVAVPNVTSADSLNNTLIISKSCALKIKQLKSKAGSDSMFLRVSVEGGGCSGFQYIFNVEADTSTISPNDDRIYERDGSKVVVDNSSFELIKGSTIDYEQELIRSAFAVVNNPQSEAACGCGSSFAVKNFAVNPAKD